MTLNARLSGKAPPASCRGATLMEVLIALVVLAIGLLGYAALQSTSLQAGHSAQLRSHATWLGYDIADRLRACKQDGGSGEMDAGCESAATLDWQALVADTLPNGTGTVQMGVEIERILREFGEDRRLFFIPLEIAIEWDDGRGDGDEPSANEQTWTFTTEI